MMKNLHVFLKVVIEVYKYLGDGEISFQEFVNTMGAQLYRTYTNEEIKATFKLGLYKFICF